MFLFLHGTGATSSLWLPQIRKILSLDKTYTDKYILDLFTMSFPGHPSNDKVFTLEDTEKLIHNFIELKKQKQLDLANEMVLSSNQEAVERLKSDKLVIVGHSLGGVCAINFSLKNPSLVQKIVLVSCGFSFNKLVLKFAELINTKIVFNLNLHTLQNLLKIVPNLRWKTALNIFIENPNRRGFLSGLEIAMKYNFEDVYKKHSLDEHLEFKKISILTINGQFDWLNPVSSVKRLDNFIKTDNNLIRQSTKAIVKYGASRSFNFKYKVYDWSGHNPMDKRSSEFAGDVRDFLAEKSI